MSHRAVALPRSSQPVSVFSPEELPAETLRTLVTAALDAARSAGAQYADIRLSTQRQLEVSADIRHPKPLSNLHLNREYGIRVQVDGVWASAHGTVLTTDAIVRSVRSAVATARGLVNVAKPRILLPGPVVTGEWRTPIGIDPFDVSPNEHAHLLGALTEVAGRVKVEPFCSVQWSAETRLFGATDGALVTQHFTRCNPRLWFAVPQGFDFLVLPIPGMAPASAGFEHLAGAAVQDTVKVVGDEMEQLSRLPFGLGEVGRKPAVFDGAAAGALIASVLAPALNLGRALGEEFDGAGTSFLSPIADVLGQLVLSRHLSMTADRSSPHFGAARWDDEGTATEPFPVIDQGRIINYFATRLTAPALAEWTAQHGQQPRVYGTAIANTAAASPAACASHLTITPSSNGPSLDELVRQLGNGILVRDSCWPQGTQLDSTLVSGTLLPFMLYEVKNGRIVRRLVGSPYLQFATRKLLNDITMVGGPTTVTPYALQGGAGFADPAVQTGTAPAMLVSQIDVLMTPQ